LLENHSRHTIALYGPFRSPSDSGSPGELTPEMEARVEAIARRVVVEELGTVTGDESGGGLRER
jgi:hypothetical protein